MLSLYCIDNIKYIYYNIYHSIQTNSIEILSMTTFIRKHTTTNIKKQFPILSNKKTPNY